MKIIEKTIKKSCYQKMYKNKIQSQCLSLTTEKSIFENKIKPVVKLHSTNFIRPKNKQHFI